METRTPNIFVMLAIALVVGIATSLGEELVFAAVLERSYRADEADVIALNAVLTSIPFLVLAFFKPRLLPWLVGIAATLAVHGWWLTKGIAYQMAPDGSGVPILGAVLMLFSPFAILLVVGVLNVAMSRRETHSA